MALGKFRYDDDANYAPSTSDYESWKERGEKIGEKRKKKRSFYDQMFGGTKAGDEAKGGLGGKMGGAGKLTSLFKG